VWAKASVGVTTDALASLNARLGDALAAVFALAAGVLGAALEHVRGHAAELHRAADAVAMLDMLAAFAAAARAGGAAPGAARGGARGAGGAAAAGGAPPAPWVRPELNADGETAIERGRHPILEAFAAPDAAPCVPNSVALGGGPGGGEGRLLLVTGANASGKSTALRMVGCVVLLAHVGSFVPAAAARVRVVARVASRLGVGDDLAASASSFVKEVREAAAILRALRGGDRTLVLVDELGRGTSPADGVAIAWAVAEALAAAPRAQTVFVTHATELRALADALAPAVALAHAAAFRFAPGAAPRLAEAYGIDLAAALGLPADLIADARALRARLVRHAAAAGGGAPPAAAALVAPALAARAAAARAAAALVDRLLPVARAAAAAGAAVARGDAPALTEEAVADEARAARRELGAALLCAGFTGRARAPAPAPSAAATPAPLGAPRAEAAAAPARLDHEGLYGGDE